MTNCIEPTTSSETTASSSGGRVPRRVSAASNGSTNERLQKEPHVFPFKLYEMLEYAADSEHGSAVSWTDDGKSFTIRNKEAFLERIVPVFFKQTKFRSFTRQLNLWGFTRACINSPNKGAWQHEHFSRGSVERLGLIHRLEVKGSQPKPPKSTTKPKQQRRKKSGAREIVPSTIMVRSPTELSLDSLAPVSFSPELLVSNAIPENTLDQHAMPSMAVQSQAPWPQQPPTQVQSFPSSMQQFFDSSIMDETQPTMLPSHMISTNYYSQVSTPTDGDLLMLLSGIFDTKESSSDDDLSSILSLNEISEHLMNPLHM